MSGYVNPIALGVRPAARFKVGDMVRDKDGDAWPVEGQWQVAEVVWCAHLEPPCWGYRDSAGYGSLERHLIPAAPRSASEMARVLRSAMKPEDRERLYEIEVDAHKTVARYQALTEAAAALRVEGMLVAASTVEALRDKP